MLKTQNNSSISATGINIKEVSDVWKHHNQITNQIISQCRQNKFITDLNCHSKFLFKQNKLNH